MNMVVPRAGPGGGKDRRVARSRARTAIINVKVERHRVTRARGCASDQG
jgi:hypothetical protein